MKQKLLTFFSAAVIIAFTACTDNDYDLSDIDTSARLTVNDLVIPVQLDGIKLDCAFDLDEDSKVQKEGDKYVIREQGTFTANTIRVQSFVATGTATESSQTITLVSTPATPAPKRLPKKARPGGGLEVAHANIPNNVTDFNFSSANIDPSIVSIDKIDVEQEIKITLKFNGLTAFISQIDVENLQVQFLKGLTMTCDKGDYNPETGIINVGDAQTTLDHVFDLTISITAIDAAKAGISLKDRNFSLTAFANVISGRLVLFSDQIKTGINISEIPTSVGYTLSSSIGNCTVKTFTGKIKYDIDGFNIDPIDLDNLPDLLSQEGTNLILANPQIYLSINNPLRQAGYGLNAQTGLSITGNDTYQITTDAIVLKQTDNSFLLAPADVTTKQAGYEHAEYVPFTDLGKVLSGNAVPRNISFNALSPMVPEQSVTNFKLGVNLPTLTGKWMFYTPISLSDASVIKYTKSWTDWQDEELDNLTVKKCTVTATISNEVPLSLDITFILLGHKGQMSGTTKVGANQRDVTIEIPLSGTDVSEIYGLTINAKIKGNNASLSPSNTITVKDMKAQLSGHYDKEL